MNKPELHPLINNASPYYNEVTGPQDKTAIEDFEDKFMVSTLMSWALVTREKYRHPKRKDKGEAEKDIGKEKTYDDYYNMLRELAIKDLTVLEMTATKAFEKHEIKWRYH